MRTGIEPVVSPLTTGCINHSTSAPYQVKWRSEDVAWKPVGDSNSAHSLERRGYCKPLYERATQEQASIRCRQLGGERISTHAGLSFNDVHQVLHSVPLLAPTSLGVKKNVD